MREIRTSGSTRGRCVADSIRGSPSYSTVYLWLRFGFSQVGQKRSGSK